MSISHAQFLFNFVMPFLPFAFLMPRFAFPFLDHTWSSIHFSHAWSSIHFSHLLTSKYFSYSILLSLLIFPPVLITDGFRLTSQRFHTWSKLHHRHMLIHSHLWKATCGVSSLTTVLQYWRCSFWSFNIWESLLKPLFKFWNCHFHNVPTTEFNSCAYIRIADFPISQSFQDI